MLLFSGIVLLVFCALLCCHGEKKTTNQVSIFTHVIALFAQFCYSKFGYVSPDELRHQGLLVHNLVALSTILPKLFGKNTFSAKAAQKM